jgi:PKD repeat protein
MGIHKVADQLLAFFKTDRTTKAWFRKVSASPPTITISINNGPNICAGDSVMFTASSTATIKDYNWNFDDGDCVIGPQVTKFFYVPGTYTVRLTGVVDDTAGNWALQTQQINVSAPPCPPH